MGNKKVSLSVRVSQDDAEFIAGLKIEDAITPSDKIRALIKQAKENTSTNQDFVGQLSILQRQLAPLLKQIKKAEHVEDIHSEFVDITMGCLTESLAFLVSYKIMENADKDKSNIDLSALENDIALKVFRYMEAVLRMGVTAKAPCYDSNLINKNIAQVLELASIISSTTSTKEKGT